MNVQRREILAMAASAAALSGLSLTQPARAQAYAARPVRLVVASAAGGVTDITARLIGEALSERLGQAFVIENRAGAGGIVGTEAVVRAPADGYTLLMVLPANAIDATLHDKLSYDFIRDIVPVAGLSQSPNVLVVHPSLPAKSVAELIAYSKANPDKINVASAGNGTTQHVAAELFNMMAGVTMRHVPYRGGALALNDLLGGQVQAMFAPVAIVTKHVTANKLRALGVTSAARLPMAPDLPTVGEFLPGYEVTAWFGIGAPRNTPSEIVNRLNAEVAVVLGDLKIKARLAELGATPFVQSPEDFRRFIGEETERWAKVVKYAGLKPG
jgi:tripartite-type tricarboxylate transporter receptor subunit TctC